MNPKFTLLAGLLAALITGASAEGRFRADDGNVGRLADNPALGADTLALGASFDADKTWTEGTQGLQFVSPLVSLGYSWTEGWNQFSVGNTLGPWEGATLGYRWDRVSDGGDKSDTHNFGFLYRPLDVVSFGVTVDDASKERSVWGGGLGLRPLVWASPRADWLTLTADGRWENEATLETVGARLSWRGSDLRFWYDLERRVPGIEATWSLGALETTVAPQRAAVALRWSPRTADFAPPGALVLKVRGTGVLASASQPAFPLMPRNEWTLDALVDVLERAAESRSVVAVAFVDPPRVAGLAQAQSLASALDKVRRAGKKVYVHADEYDDSLGFQSWVAAADRVVVDPTGSVILTAASSRKLYLKGLFDNLGIRFVNFAPWETKSANNTLTFSSMPEAERAMLTRFLTDRQDQTVAALAAGRGPRLKAAAADLVAQGPYLIAQKALEAGLVDALENRSDFEAALAKAHPGATVVNELPREGTQAWGPPTAGVTVALVHLTGDIVGGTGQAGRSIGRAAVETLQAIREDASIRAVVLRVNSPGGAVLPSDALADQVRKTVAAGKPVLVVMDDLAASGGYYLAAPATRIWARPGTLTGSIGVTAALFTALKALEKLGIQADGVELGASAAFGDWTREPAPGQLAQWSAMIDATYQRFLDVVAQGRSIDKAKLEPLARGQIYTGREALTLGLVDALGGQDEAQAWLEDHFKGSVVWREYLPGDTSTLGGLLDPLMNSLVSSSSTLRLAAALDRWAGPGVDELTGVLARGEGPLVWCPVEP